jgi:hypothetical protein
VSWKCSCGIVNAGCNTHCAADTNWTHVEHHQVSNNTPDLMMYLKARRDFDQMTDQEAEFTQFFNSEITLISAMSDEELIDHITELESIAKEAKARLTAAKSHQRDKTAKKRIGGDWSVIATEPDATVTDSINKVAMRKQRMTKFDKMEAKLQALGLDKKDIDQMMSGLRKTAVKDTPEARVETAKRVAEVIIKKVESAQNYKPDETTAEQPITVDLSKLKFT